MSCQIDYLKQEYAYHYTSFEALLKIIDGVQNGNFIMHASSVFAMNDPTELRYGYKKIMESLPNIESSIGISDDKYKLSKLWDKDKSFSHEQWREIHIQMLDVSTLLPFVISLSRNRDYLPLWNMYGKQGYGVALGFDTRIYMIGKGVTDGIQNYDFTHIDFSKPHSIDVVYEGIAAESNVNLIIKYEYSQYLKSVQNLTKEDDIAKIQLHFLTLILTLAAVFVKHGAYKYEEETRFITKYKDLSEIKFRTGTNNPIPYVEYALPIGSLKEIIVGPCADFDFVRHCLAIKMRQKGIENVEISQSAIPYRNLNTINKFYNNN